MTRTLTTTDVEPDDTTSWIAAVGGFAFVRADNAKPSSGERRWYALEMDYSPESGSGSWVLAGDEAFPWSEVDGPDYDPSAWPLTEGPSDLYDLVMREVGR